MAYATMAWSSIWQPQVSGMWHVASAGQVSMEQHEGQCGIMVSCGVLQRPWEVQLSKVFHTAHLCRPHIAPWARQNRQGMRGQTCDYHHGTLNPNPNPSCNHEDGIPNPTPHPNTTLTLTLATAIIMAPATPATVTMPLAMPVAYPSR